MPDWAQKLHAGGARRAALSIYASDSSMPSMLDCIANSNHSIEHPSARTCLRNTVYRRLVRVTYSRAGPPAPPARTHMEVTLGATLVLPQ